jgi:hypothetical protein
MGELSVSGVTEQHDREHAPLAAKSSPLETEKLLGGKLKRALCLNRGHYFFGSTVVLRDAAL